MFRTAAPGISRTAESFTTAMTEWRDSSDSWFNGIGSVDARLSRCAKLIHTAESAVGRLPAGDSGQYLAAIQELSADRQVIASLREDLLTGNSGREAVGVSRSPGRTASTKAPTLSGQERRWVDLESAKFVTANRDVAHVADELTERARRHAELHTSTLGAKRSREVTAAFVDKVADLGHRTPRPRTASAPTTIPDFPDHLLFLA